MNKQKGSVKLIIGIIIALVIIAGAVYVIGQKQFEVSAPPIADDKQAWGDLNQGQLPDNNTEDSAVSQPVAPVDGEVSQSSTSPSPSSQQLTTQLKPILFSLRTQAGLGLDNSSTYLADLCTIPGHESTGGFNLLLKSYKDLAGQYKDQIGEDPVRCTQNAVSGVRPTGWAVVGKLPEGKFFCTDSSGFASEVSSFETISLVSNKSADVSCTN